MIDEIAVCVGVFGGHGSESNTRQKDFQIGFNLARSSVVRLEYLVI